MSVKLVVFLLLHLISASAETITAKPECPSTCGNITIPYPFGIGSSCSIDKWAEFKCVNTYDPPKLMFRYLDNFEVAEILQTEIRVKNSISTICYNSSGGLAYEYYYSKLDSNTNPYTFSSKNKFTVIGCGVLGLFHGVSDRNFTSGCTALCDKMENVVDGPCSGGGCCQFQIPKGLKYYAWSVDILNFSSADIPSTNCGSAFLADQDYMFKKTDFYNPTNGTILLNFAVGNGKCKDAAQNHSSFACKENSYCYDPADGTGYLCNCKEGYEGNPYLNQGCQDVNECENPKNNTCKWKCTNTQGGYHCSDDKVLYIWLISGLGLGFLSLIAGSLWIYSRRKRRILKLREKFFQQNGGLLLKQQISSQGGAESTKMFTAKELELATNNYDESRILGQGGYGTVYKGVLPDLRVVAIKKSKVIDKDQLEQFINEIVILTQISHRNIVKLFGCCLETELPLLVYEFVSNGTLSHHIRKRTGSPYTMSFVWEDRLRIAAETAGALAYLHSAASTPIIHRDVKSSNILLDDHYTAKVADFGASRLNPLDQTQISTLVKGTLGYLDPEYMHTSQLTEKSDVYSFGVVLAELLTGEKPLSFEKSQNERNLAMYFTASMDENRLFQIIEKEIVDEGSMKQVQAVAELGRRCLNVKGEDRPSMKEVAAELEALGGFSKRHTTVQKSQVEEVDLYPSSSYSGTTSEEVGLHPSSSHGSRASEQMQKGLLTSMHLPR